MKKEFNFDDDINKWLPLSDYVLPTKTMILVSEYDGWAGDVVLISEDGTMYSDNLNPVDKEYYLEIFDYFFIPENVHKVYLSRCFSLY